MTIQSFLALDCQILVRFLIELNLLSESCNFYLNNSLVIISKCPHKNGTMEIDTVVVAKLKIAKSASILT